MAKEQLSQNLGTIARSGTSEFVQQLEQQKKDASAASLIGQFGLGFYSSFLVAQKVTVASKSVESEVQYVFESEADAEGFKIYEDPRGNTLGRGTEITLWLKSESNNETDVYLEESKLKELITRHASFNSAPIFLWEAGSSETAQDEDESAAEQGAWQLVNDQAPLWMRDPKEVSDAEYEVSQA